MLELILLGLAVIAYEAFVTFVVLVMAEILDWFLKFEQELDDATLAFTVRQQLDNGEYTVYQGLFDAAGNEVRKARKISAKRLDERLRELHNRDELAIYE
ncbi:hypothetical protein Sme01_18510 [Sphaerisporangium melleum]|uniref:Uncharacterized protein n=1 Tax=Sphaerisporangium melleum TaxID=321316 RepID=A0A917RLY9_9ACTN|nr:hypothetical protein [Sphaerisporangium melleum]GGL14658.1 hypothetical protein GCM10007964_65880 [Sphaerisporangium melleum]GII69375.1 hypothetical protein Sme01_18510 [Sphaerisporangium melleum]